MYIINKIKRNEIRTTQANPTLQGKLFYGIEKKEEKKYIPKGNSFQIEIIC